MFDPKAHLIQLPRRVRDPISGHYKTVHDDYLEVKWRLVWFRERYPHGSILTEEVCVDLDRGYARYRATVDDGEGGKATGTGTETAKSFTDYVEKAETRAIGRALAALGIGTQFVGEELSEGEHVADAPVSPQPSPAEGLNLAPRGRSVTPASTNGHAPTMPHPTAEQVAELVAIAESAHEPKEVFATQLRRIMGVTGEVRISKKFLRESMTLTQFEVARAYYEQLLKQQVEEDTPDHQAPSPTRAPSASPGDDAPPDADAEAREALVREAMDVGLPEGECRHVVTMHRDLAKAREILTQAARKRIQAA